MNLVVLDGFTLNPGDLNWADLQALGACEVFDRTPPQEVTLRAAKAEVVLTNKVVLSKEIIFALPKLKYIGVLATGTNVVDLEAARSRKIPVTNVPAYGTCSVAQAAFALLLELTNRVGHHAQTVQNGRWNKAPDWCYWNSPLRELAGLTFGVVGYGRIGAAVAEIAHAFGMKVIAFSPTKKGVPFVRFVGLEEVFRDSDVLSLHCPLTPQTRHLVNAPRLQLMKPSALLLNTSRGLLVEEGALAEALNSRRLAGAGLDVLSTEPPADTNPLLHAQNCYITPHNAWATQAARARLLRIAVENIRAFLSGKPVNVVN